MSNYFEHEYKLSPLVEDIYALINKHYGNPLGYKKLKGDKEDLFQAVNAALIIWGALAAKGTQLGASEKLGINRNTVRKMIKNNKYLEPVRSDLFKTNDYDAYAMKNKMRLADYS